MILPKKVALVAGVVMFRRGKKPKKSQIGKQLKKMFSSTEKGRVPDAPVVRSRQEIITEIFTEKMEALDLTPSTDSGFIPISYTPLAQMLSEHGISNDIISAILTGLQEEDDEQSIREIIDAAADTRDVSLSGESLELAKDLAVEEWKRMRESATD